MLYGYGEQLLSGLWVTLELTAASLALGIFLGILFAVAKQSHYKSLSWPVTIITQACAAYRN